MKKVSLAPGCWCVEIPEAGLSILCGSPENAVKFLYRAGCIRDQETDGVRYEKGPNGILLSEVPIQNGAFSNVGEFPVLHMLYLQGMMVPGHPNNTGRRPLVIGLKDQVEAQCRYIFTGNYGLSSVEEMVAAGLSPDEARRQMRMKLFFAYGKVKPTEDLLDLRVFDNDAVELAPCVFLHRKALNVYEFLCSGQSEEVDLNLRPGDRYGAPYRLPSRKVVPAEFAVVHLGDGDGWDPTRPCTGSLIVHGDDLGLVDAGPNLNEGLEALGLSVNRINRLFQTHGHDDHFVGLTALMRSEKRVRYHAVPWVRASVEKKFQALTGLDASDFSRFFDVHDLVPDQWNQLEGLEVLPLFSPHPVETTIFHFRVAGAQGYKTYAHLADIAAFSVLDAMTQDDPADFGLTAADVRGVKEVYRRPAEVKKIDIGEGMIHGHAADFAGDGSPVLLLSHTGRELNAEELALGRRPEFGETSVLIPRGRDQGPSDAFWEPGPPPSRELAIRALFHPEVVSSDLVGRLARAAVALDLPKGQPVDGRLEPGLHCVVKGTIRLSYGGTYADQISPGGFFGEEGVLFREVSPFHATALVPVHLLFLPTEFLEDCPLLLWKLREAFERRLKAVGTVFRFDWRPEYAVNVELIDGQHRHLFGLIAAIGDAVAAGASAQDLGERLRILILYTSFHFKTEQDLMETHGYPLRTEHAGEHRKLFAAIEDFRERLKTQGLPLRHDLMEFLKVWLLRHTLLEDRKYMGFFREKGLATPGSF